MDGKAIDFTRLNFLLFGKMDPDSIDLPPEQLRELWDRIKAKVDSVKGVVMFHSTLDETDKMGWDSSIWNTGDNSPSSALYRFFYPEFPRHEFDPLEKLEIYEKEYLPMFIDYTVEYLQAWEMYTKKGLWMFPDPIVSFEKFLKSK